MSQQQTVRITTTETSAGSALIINSGYLKTAPGLLKFAQLVNIHDQPMIRSAVRPSIFHNYLHKFIY